MVYDSALSSVQASVDPGQTQMSTVMRFQSFHTQLEISA